ncbi:MAG: aldehyde dehydrogenase (NADP(+)), partial [Bacteroidota bacterium]
MFNDATIEEIDEVMKNAWKAFHQYRKLSLKERAGFMRAIAIELEACGDELIQTSMRETNLPEARMRSERARTIFQLTSYAEYCERGTWLDVRIDTADINSATHKTDIRKTLVPLGPVIVFGSSNFPFAYSTAGGDTATALAAGCPVIVKAHPAHAETSEIVANAILLAAEKCNMPKGVFAHVHGASFEVGKTLVMHPHTKAVGFTGSYPGGKQLFDWGNQRKEPIPVFSEMGSVNPVFLLPEKLKQSAAEVAKMFAESITGSVGQFCTKPGLIIGLESDGLNEFIKFLGEEIKSIAPGTMLHPGIFKSYVEKRANALVQEHVETISVSETEPLLNQGSPTIASATGEAFLNNPILHQEVFGPYSIIVRCKDMTEMIEVVRNLEGQLTATLMATETDINYHEELVEVIKNICGRFILNGVPTGVQVGLSMQHGGPFPATTDPRFTSVG